MTVEGQAALMVTFTGLPATPAGVYWVPRTNGGASLACRPGRRFACLGQAGDDSGAGVVEIPGSSPGMTAWGRAH